MRQGPPFGAGPSHVCEPVCKPDSVVGDHLSGTVVAFGLARPTWDIGRATRPYLALLPVGFT